jgi:tetratricopeptide (TPR) repeat protein
VPALEALDRAVTELARLRSGGDAEHPRSPAVAFEDARRALLASEREAAGLALRDLSGLTGAGRGAAFLAAALFAPAESTRPMAIGVLSDLLAKDSTPAVRRALAARALEGSDGEAMSRALAEAGSVFGPADRLSLAALAGGADALAQAADALAGQDDLLPLAAAATASSKVGAHLPVGDPEIRARLALGRGLATVTTLEELKEQAHALRAAAPDAPLGRVLSLELDAAAGATSAVAVEVARLASENDEAAGKVVAALIEEFSGHADIARRLYSGAVSAPGLGEAATRAMLPTDPRAADVLSTLASMLPESGSVPRRALLLFEAAVRAGAEDPEKTGTLLELSHAVSPDLPFAARYGTEQARTRGDVDALLAWLRRQRAASSDPVGRALDAVREALLTADGDHANAAALIADAVAARPDDVALLTLAERLGAVPAIERGRWRERVAERVELPRTRSWLLTEAAREYERAGATEDAVRAAAAARAAGGSGLATVLSQRLAPEGPEAPLEGLAAVRAAEGRAFESGTDDELAEISSRLVDLPDAGETFAHARLAVRLATRGDKWDSTRELVERASRHSPSTLWLLRQRAEHARMAHDDAHVLDANETLEARVARPLDKATLALRAAEVAVRLGRLDQGFAFLARTLELAPDHIVARHLRAKLAEERGEARIAAEDYEAIASASSIPDHRFEAWYRAAVLWLDAAKDEDRGLTALEHAGEIDVLRKDVFDRLQLLYVQRGDRTKLAELLKARLAKTDSPEERILLEVTRGRALAEIGDLQAAREALSAALDANPDHAEALEAFAGLCISDGAFQNAEQAFIRLARVATDPEKQADIYGRLARLYDEHLPNPNRAEICYREILKRRPDDVAAMEALVRVYVRLAQPVKALELQTALVEKATSNDEKRDRMLALSVVYDEAAKDKKSAFAILEKARKTWPHDATVLRAQAEAHLRHEETAAVNVLLDRAAAEARRALAHGRFEAAFFGILETAASVRGQADAALLASAALAALEGREEPAVRGAGGIACKTEYDDLVAPEVLGSALRAMLQKLPGVLDAAYPVDVKSIKAAPLPPSHAELGGEIRAVAESVGVRSLELLVSPALGATFLPASATRLIVGQPLLDGTDEAARYFLLVRVLKMMQSEGAALARMAPIDLWPAMAALLSLIAKGWQPQGVDAGKLADAQRRIQAAMPARLDDDLATLALEVAGSLGNRASQLGQAVGQWGCRTALLAAGSVGTALRGIALSGGGDGPPRDAAERLKWVLRQPEAKDLAVFSVSEGYVDARRRIGL